MTCTTTSCTHPPLVDGSAAPTPTRGSLLYQTAQAPHWWRGLGCPQAACDVPPQHQSPVTSGQQTADRENGWCWVDMYWCCELSKLLAVIFRVACFNEAPLARHFSMVRSSRDHACLIPNFCFVFDPHSGISDNGYVTNHRHAKKCWGNILHYAVCIHTLQPHSMSAEHMGCFCTMKGLDTAHEGFHNTEQRPCKF